MYESYTESFTEEEGHKYHLTIKCVRCQKLIKVTVNGPDLFLYNQGTAPIQECFPYLDPEEREMFMTRICGECFKKMFDEEEE